MHTRASMRARAEAGNCVRTCGKRSRFDSRGAAASARPTPPAGATRYVSAGGPPRPTRTGPRPQISDRRRRPAVARRGSETSVRPRARRRNDVTLTRRPRRDRPRAAPRGTARSPQRAGAGGQFSSVQFLRGPPTLHATLTPPPSQRTAPLPSVNTSTAGGRKTTPGRARARGIDIIKDIIR